MRSCSGQITVVPPVNAVGERSLQMRALGLRGENLARMRAEHGDAPSLHRECAAFALRNLRDLADQDAVCHVTRPLPE